MINSASVSKDEADSGASWFSRRCEASSGTARSRLLTMKRWRCWLALLQFQRGVLAVFVDRRAPDLVRGLVLGAAECQRRAEAETHVAHGLEIVDQLLGVELRTGLPQCLDQHIRRDIALERDIV